MSGIAAASEESRNKSDNRNTTIRGDRISRPRPVRYWSSASPPSAQVLTWVNLLFARRAAVEYDL